MPALLLLAVALVLLTPSPASASAWAWPLDGASPSSVARPFAPGPTPYSPGHRGVDLAARPGAAVRSAGAGVVAYAGPLAGRGVVVVVHGTLRTTYEPVRARAQVGQPVLAGQPIGSVEPGHRGCPASACLHWGLRRGLHHLDPLRLVGLGRVRLLPWGHQGPLAADSAGPSAAPAAGSRAAGPGLPRTVGSSAAPAAGPSRRPPAPAAGTGPGGPAPPGPAGPSAAPGGRWAPRPAPAPLPGAVPVPPLGHGGAGVPGGEPGAGAGGPPAPGAAPLAAVAAGLAGGAWLRRRVRTSAPPWRR